MEMNGMLFDTEECIKQQAIYQEKYNGLSSTLDKFALPVPINWNSGDHLSAVLYGGPVVVRVREVVQKEYKAGVKNVERWSIKTVQLPRLVEPVKGSERDKEGYFFVNEPVLRSLKPTTKRATEILKLVLELSEVEKLLNTYYIGLPKLIDQQDWSSGMIHGSINQCVTRTGRSSSSKPNLQNFAGTIKHLFKSRFAT
jgi:DNA polymerase I-like protein with 3'-5' exonuclease and polymerase domains